MLARHTALAVGVLAVLVAAGCTTTSEGTPAPATTVETTTTNPSTTSPSSGQELPFAGAPKVDNPIDTTRFQKDPCQTLTSDQVESLDLSLPGKPVNDMPLGLACDWTNPDTRALVEIHFADRDPRGLSAVYLAHRTSGYAVFREMPPIEGHPAVVADILDQQDKGYCTVVVGVTDETTFDVPVRQSPENVGKKDPCEVSALVAGMALQTMKRG